MLTVSVHAATFDDSLPDPEPDFLLHARHLGRRQFLVEFGGAPGLVAGDGGEWRVEYDDEGAVIACERVSEWMS